jgi:hypothetical protein
MYVLNVPTKRLATDPVKFVPIMRSKTLSFNTGTIRIPMEESYYTTSIN